MNGRLLAIGMGILILLGAAYATRTIRREKDAHFERAAALRRTLGSMRNALERFHAKEGRYPRSLQELTPQYLNAIPTDPVTGSRETWKITTEQAVQPSSDFTSGSTATAPETTIIEIHSGADGKDATGVPFADY